MADFRSYLEGLLLGNKCYVVTLNLYPQLGIYFDECFCFRELFCM